MRIENLEMLHRVACKFLEEEGKQEREGATVITLSGDLGAGKTAFVKEVANCLSVKEEVTSPTFVIQKEYIIPEHSLWKKLVHIDAYRLESKSELEYLGWDELIRNSENIIFIEWPEQVEGIDFNNATQVHIKILDDDAREVEILR